jgi:biopolymer transport protein ExbB
MFGEMSLIDLFKASPTMLVLLGCSIITVGFALERLFYFTASATNSKKFMQELSSRLKSGNVKQGLEFCNTGKGAVARVMRQAMMNFGRNREELLQRINTAIEVEQVEMERNLSVLGTMSNIAPLLGLFGTVIGIIRAFADIARTGSGGSSVVAMGVSEALFTTAAGIIVAVIATIFFNIFVRRIRTRIVELEDAREAFFAMWSARQRGKAQSSGTSQRSQQVKAPAPAPALATAGRDESSEREPVAAGFFD